MNSGHLPVANVAGECPRLEARQSVYRDHSLKQCLTVSALTENYITAGENYTKIK